MLMECNKEEASRAKAIAEKKMQEKDFAGALKFAKKAQQLYPETENISQLICVCDVHCSAESKMYGNESDWYGILQIGETADDTLIKKQYRKFALLLHPDKNKFSGAESAFKLIGEAQRVLLDREKRSFYDMKRRTSFRTAIQNQASQQTGRPFNTTQRSKVQATNAKGFNAPFQESKQQAQSGAANGKETFWTMCPFCNIRYQYYKEVLNRALKCQTCKKPFIAYNMQEQTRRPGTNSTQPVFPQQGAPNVRASQPGSESVNPKPGFNPASQAAENAEFVRSQQAKQSYRGSDNFQRKGEQGSKPPPKASKKGRKQVVESSESFESESSLESEDSEIQSDGDTPTADQFDNGGDQQTRRSSRNKRRVSYNENENETDDVETMNLPKRPKGNENSDAPQNEQHAEAFSQASASVNGNSKGVFNNLHSAEAGVESKKKSPEVESVVDVDSSSEANEEAPAEPDFYEYPDPEFCDFDKDRSETCFKGGQVWAAYATGDTFPRFYAKIRRVNFSPKFRLQITWFEPDPDDEVGKMWAESELPFSCGKFKFGDSEYTGDRLSFSHLVSWEKGSSKDSTKIYPRKGETWALFKNWDPKWYQVSAKERKYEYEFVEVLSEYDDTLGIRVIRLGKLKGFASLFCRIDDSAMHIQPGEMLRFSHRAPSYRMTGNERVDVPRGSFELDPASVPMNFKEISLSKVNGPYANDLPHSSAAEVKSSVEAPKKSASTNRDNGVEQVNPPDVDVDVDADVEDQEVPDCEFFNFDGEKSFDKFHINQIWALYSDVDGLPNYYGIVKRIDPPPRFKLHIAWLEACHPAGDMVLWKDKDMPISCGEFRVKGGKLQQYTDTGPFSHQLQAEQTAKRNVFAIYPKKGEIWALYKDWHPDMATSALENCKYDIVEVVEQNPLYLKVSFLERVDGFNSVFKPQKSGDSPVTEEIPLVQLLKFSHQIPCFKLTDEKDGSLRGFWELDTAAVPAHILCK